MSTFSSRMIMRAEILRNTAAADAHGNPGKPAYNLVKDDVPCFVWSKVRVLVVDGHQNSEVEDLSVIFRAEADVQAFDIIQQIKDRRGRVLLPGRFEVRTGNEKTTGAGVDHLSFKLRRIK